jgi:hypothetical protein
MKRTRVTISLSPKNEDAATVLRALEKAPYWKRSAELLRWAAAYLNGKALEQTSIVTGIDMTDDELDALLDDF